MNGYIKQKSIVLTLVLLGIMSNQSVFCAITQIPEANATHIMQNPEAPAISVKEPVAMEQARVLETQPTVDQFVTEMLEKLHSRKNNEKDLGMAEGAEHNFSFDACWQSLTNSLKLTNPSITKEEWKHKGAECNEMHSQYQYGMPVKYKESPKLKQEHDDAFQNYEKERELRNAKINDKSSCFASAQQDMAIDIDNKAKELRTQAEAYIESGVMDHHSDTQIKTQLTELYNKYFSEVSSQYEKAKNECENRFPTQTQPTTIAQPINASTISVKEPVAMEQAGVLETQPTVDQFVTEMLEKINKNKETELEDQGPGMAAGAVYNISFNACWSSLINSLKLTNPPMNKQKWEAKKAECNEEYQFRGVPMGRKYEEEPELKQEHDHAFQNYEKERELRNAKINDKSSCFASAQQDMAINIDNKVKELRTQAEAYIESGMMGHHSDTQIKAQLTELYNKYFSEVTSQYEQAKNECENRLPTQTQPITIGNQ